VSQPATLFNEDTLRAFLNQTGWRKTAPVGQDTSIRRYFRVEKNGQTAILMESVPDNSPHMTRGHKMADFIRIAQWLNENSLNAPDIVETDLDHGYMILEDFGATSFKAASEQGAGQAALYSAAANVLKALASARNPPALPQYYDSHVHHNHRFIIEHYLPTILGEIDTEGVTAQYLKAWNEIEVAMPPCPQGFLHIDFHAENLMHIPDAHGLNRCGILDFQGAMIGPLPYDLANLLEDARIDVPPALRAATLAQFDAEFQSWYRILATQFHCRVLGQFIKIAQDGNPNYLQHLPRLERYMREALQNPLLKPLKDFFDDLKVDFCATNDLNSSEIQRLTTTTRSE
jgi:aminoglycoside/choline kinase family phosphotransferase